jgi:hypothetical protein
MATLVFIRWRRMVRTVAFLLVFVALTLFAQRSETSEQYINRLTKEAAGSQPVQESRFPRQRAMDNTFRSLLRTLIQQNRAFFAAASKVDREKIKKVMTPESFADPALGADVVKELDAYADLEQKHGAEADQSFADLRHTFETADWSAPQRERMLKSFDSILAEPQGLRHNYLQAEKAYVESVDDLYHVAAEHKAVLKIENGDLKVFDDDVLEELNKRIKLANSRREEMLKARQTYKDSQNQRLQSIGIDLMEVGIQ